MPVVTMCRLECVSQLSNAKEEIEKAVRLKPDDATLHFVLGRIYRRLGSDEQAKLEFDRYSSLTAVHSAATASQTSQVK
jgi:Flp pilus assembly protein TadD